MTRGSQLFPGFEAAGLDEPLLRFLIDEHERAVIPRLERLWRYYRNPVEGGGWAGEGRAGRRLGQERGLPRRLTGPRSAHEDDRSEREIVIENDIAWRVQAMVDFMFGKPVKILSTARDAGLRRRIESVLDAVWETSGGIALLQDMALLGHVYGHVDLLLRSDGSLHGVPGEGTPGVWPRVEVVEPSRGIPVLNPGDYRRLDAYVVHLRRELNRVERDRSRGRASWRGWLPGSDLSWTLRRAESELTEVIGPDRRRVYEEGRLTADTPNVLTPGDLPVVHVQNISEPFRYEGLGEVEPLIPLQDELNTRLSDRASRVTMQSFKMYLAKGLDGFDRVPVGLGRVWATDNPEASIQSVGGDAESPSESAHIQEVREAFDKVSGVPPLASGVVRAKIGNLTSANALRITLMGLLSKTARKRVTYGGGISRMCGLVLRSLDEAGVLRTDVRDRGVKLAWPDPLPDDVNERVAAARAKAELGVSTERVLAELGYEPDDPGLA
jgi:hypothetical protein